MEKDFNNICRRLANPMRVNLLRTVMASPERDGLPVYQLADLAFMKTPAACQYLIHLEEECGLVESTRAGRYVLYRTRRNVADPDLSRLVRALSSFFRAEGRGACDVNGARASDPAFVRLMPALANAKRVQALSEIRAAVRISAPEIQRRCSLSAVAVRRHLLVLAKSGVVKDDGEAYSFAEPSDRLSRLFLSLALGARR